MAEEEASFSLCCAVASPPSHRGRMASEKLVAAQTKEVALLITAIERIAPKASPRTVKFSEVFTDEALGGQLSSLLGTLKAARKQGLIEFQGQMLLQGKDDDVPITLVEARDTAEVGEPPEGGSPEDEVHYSDGESSQCAKSKAAFAALISSGAVNDTTLVWMEGWDEWTPLSKCRKRLAVEAAQAEPEPAPEPAAEAAAAPAVAPAGEAAIANNMQVQWNGKGAFQFVYMEMTETMLTVRKKKGGKEVCSASAVGATVNLPKNERKGHPHSFRVDLKRPDSAGHTKYICSAKDSGVVSQWMQAFMYGVQANPLAATLAASTGALHRTAHFVRNLPSPVGEGVLRQGVPQIRFCCVPILTPVLVCLQE